MPPTPQDPKQPDPHENHDPIGEYCKRFGEQRFDENKIARRGQPFRMPDFDKIRSDGRLGPG